MRGKVLCDAVGLKLAAAIDDRHRVEMLLQHSQAALQTMRDTVAEQVVTTEDRVTVAYSWQSVSRCRNPTPCPCGCVVVCR